MPYRIEKIGETFGARIIGLDLRDPIDATDAEALRGDLLEHRLLVLGDQDLAHDDQVRFSRLFGPLDVYPVSDYVVPDHPEILVISNIFRDGRPIGLYDGDDQEEWHADYSWKPSLSRSSLFYSAIAPEVGGDTLFADTTTAYDELPEALRERVETLKAVHSMTYLVEQECKVNPHKAPLTAEESARMPDVTQPLVFVHPETGRCSLLLGSMIIKEVPGLSPDESRELLDELHARATAERYLLRHHYAVGDLVVWDNRSVIHTRTACDRHVSPRLLYRTTVL